MSHLNRPPILIIEGCDRTGKTTLCKYLELTCGYTIYKPDGWMELPKWVDPKSYHFGNMHGSLNAIASLNGRVPFVLDRFHWSEAVYGKIYRNYDLEYFVEIDLMLESMGAKVILMDDKIEEINQRAGKNLSMDYAMFKWVALHSSIPHFVYNQKHPIASLMNWLDGEKESCATAAG